MNVLEFIRAKTEDLQGSVTQFRAKLEPQFQHWSNTFNNKISNTLNNPWMIEHNPFEGGILFSSKNVIQNAAAEKAYKELKKQIGQELFVGDWVTIDQNCIDQFAEVTGDNQWIHTDPVRANKESPFKTTIAHGFLTLSLIPQLTNAINSENNLYPEARMLINYGLNQVRFPFPVKSGSKVRARTRLVVVTPMKNSIEIVNEVSIEVENRKRFACVAEIVQRLYF
ncbi:MAG: MaoC family dehydratase [Candidatus Marinimicrobia bacterium]|nr:MaoC family dehydratase [Candidatus Neomarinimicrobiota bacterium]MCH7762191.1 MaoC family dehydratase [Candidatus Neomarinimicrobiota bacterium]